MDMEDMAIVPVASAQMLFNTESLPRVLVEAKSRESTLAAKADVERILMERHQGERDVTVVTQDAVLSTFDNVLQALTMTVAGIAAISLAVAGILIMNVMLVAVAQRTTEIGLLKALGAAPAQIERMFLVEASLLSMIGSSLGLLLGLVVAWAGRQAYPDIPFSPPWWALLAAILVAVLAGLIFGVMPARRAARLDAVDALARGKN
jgi:putative ABC transport system permease protein